MIATDGKPTIANWPLSRAGSDVQAAPASPEGKAAQAMLAADRKAAQAMLAADRAAESAGLVLECWTVIGVDTENQRFAFVFEAINAQFAEAKARNQYGPDILIAGVVRGDVQVVA